MKSTSLKTLENTELKDQSPTTSTKPVSNENPLWFLTDSENVVEFVQNDAFLNPSVFSYKNITTSGGGSRFFLDDSSAVSEKASVEEITIFGQGLFYGFTIMLVLLNLVCFFLFNEKSFLYYSLALLGACLIHSFSDQLLGLWGWQLGAYELPVLTTVLFLGVVAYTFFAHQYLNIEEFVPNLKWWTFGLVGFAGLCVAFSWMTGKEVFARASNIALFATLASYFISGVTLFSKKNYAKFYVIGMFIPMLFAIDYFVLRPLGVPFLMTETPHLKAASIAEMLIITYAITYRMQALKEEHALRQAEMRIFLRRQEVLSTRQKTEKLVEDVYLENLIMHYDLDGLEIKLLQYISEGKDNAKIARKLKTTETDVEDLTKELYEKLEIGEQIQQDYRMVEEQPDYIYN